MGAFRQEVYQVIDKECIYQDDRWNHQTTTSGGRHSVAEWLVIFRTTHKRLSTKLVAELIQKLPKQHSIILGK
jgi:hypothetical protein